MRSKRDDRVQALEGPLGPTSLHALSALEPRPGLRLVARLEPMSEPPLPRHGG